jgi:rhomboid protease GluP
MQDNVPRHASELSFPVEYQEFAGALYNSKLRGKGTLVIREPGPNAAFIFAGEKREAFSSGATIELTFRANQLWNVTSDGRCVRFETVLEKTGAQKITFVFFCASEKDVAAVIAQLPKSPDADLLAARGFMSRLNEISGTGGPWSSVTNLIVGANIAVFIVMGLLGAGWLETENLLPYIRYGANNGAATTDGEWWRLVTSMFMHYGLIHLLLNMWALFQAGHLVEKLLGRRAYTLMYFGSGIVSGLATLAWNGDQKWSAGASGAVFGVYGALLGYMLREKHALPAKIYRPLSKSTLTFAAYNLVYGSINPRIDNAAHIGGALGGAVIATTWQRGFTYEHRTQRTVIAACIAVVLAAGATVYVRNRTDPYLYMNVDERMQAAYSAFQSGHCDRARIAMNRAIQMDPNNRFIRAGGDEIARECSDPSSDRPSPRLRQ